MNYHPRDETRCNFQTNVNLKPTSEELEEQARHLGIDPIFEKELLWIAEKSWLSELPEPWVPLENEKKQIYFYNTKTMVSMWDHPYDDHFRTLAHQERAGRLSRITNSSPEDSGIACVTRNSMRSTPQPLKPITNSSPSIISPGPKLSADFLSPTLTVPGNSVTPINKTKVLSPINSTTSKNLSSMNLSADFGKNRFLKSDRVKLKPVEDNKADIEAKFQQSNVQVSPQVKFNLDLDDLSDVSHYSYEDTEGLGSEDIDPLDVANLLDATSKSRTLVNMAASQSLTLSQDSSRRNSLQKPFERPSIIPQNYRTRDENQLSEKCDSYSQSVHNSNHQNLQQLHLKDENPLISEPPVENARKNLENAKESRFFNSAPKTNGSKELQKRHEEDIKEMERKFSEEKIMLKIRNETLLKKEEHFYEEQLCVKKSELEEALKQQNFENERHLKHEKEIFLKRLTDEMKRMESEERSRLIQEFSKVMTLEKDRHNEEMQTLRNKMDIEIKDLEKQHGKIVEEHKGAKAKLILTQEGEFQALKEKFSFQVLKEQQELDKKLEVMKSSALEEHKLKLDALKNSSEFQLAELQNELKKQQQTASEENVKTVLSAEVDNLTLQVESLKAELEIMKKTVKTGKEALRNQQLPYHIEQISRKVEPQPNYPTLVNEASDNNNIDYFFQRPQFTTNSQPNVPLTRNCHLCNHHKMSVGSTFDNSVKQSQSNSEQNMVVQQKSEEIAAMKAEPNKLEKANDKSDIKSLLEPVYEQLQNISKKVDNLQNRNSLNDREEESDSLSTNNTVDLKRKSHTNEAKRSINPSPLDEGVLHLSQNLLQVSGQLSGLLEGMNSKVPPYVNSGHIGSSYLTNDFSSKMPNLSPSPDHHNRIEAAALERWKVHFNDTSISSSIHEAGSYSSLIYPYGRISQIDSRRPSYCPESSSSIKERLDAQKTWLRDYHKQRQVPSNF